MKRIQGRGYLQTFTAALLLVAGIVIQAFWAPQALAATDYRVYLGNQGDGTLSVIDSNTNTVSAMIPVGQPHLLIAVSPDGLRVYTPNLNAGTISVLDVINNSVLTTIPVGLYPTSVFMDPSGLRIYVLVGGESKIKVINTQTYAVEAEIPGLTGAGTGRMSLDGSRLYINNQVGNSIFVIDTSSNTVIDTIPGIGPEPGQIAVAPDGDTIYVATRSGLTVVNSLTHAILAVIPEIANGTPSVTPDGDRVYAHIAGTGIVKVLDAHTNTVTNTIIVGSSSIDLIASPYDSRVYVSDFGEAKVYVIDTVTDSVITAIPVPAQPGALAIGVVPSPKDQCKHGGWQNFTNPTFHNQGECIRFVEER